MNRTFLILLLGFVLTSCSREYYPTTVNAPFFNEPGEFEASILTGNSGADLHLAYAVADQFALMVNGSFADRKQDENNTFFENAHKHIFGEFGAGYFLPSENAFRFEIYGGYGMGQMEGTYSSSSSYFYDTDQAFYRKIFLQPQVGVSNDVFEGGISTRFTSIILSSPDVGRDNTGFFMQPVIISKVGYKYIKFIGEIGLSIPLNSEQIEFDYAPLIMSVGVNFSFGNYD